MICLLTMLSFTASIDDPKPETGFLDRTFKNNDGSTSPYVVYIPKGYDASKKYPVLLFLHGSGETKGGSKQPVEVGIGPAIKKRADFPFIVVIPQSEKRTWKAKTDDGNRALAILDEVMKDYATDADRVILTGLSMGGFGTWSLGFSEKDRWAALVPICGGGDPRFGATFKDMPIWCFHGGADKVVPAKYSQDMIEAIKKAGGEPKYTEYEGVGHNSWDDAYGTDELYKWMLKQKRKR